MIKHLEDLIKNRAGLAIAVIFLCSGLVFGSWASFIPFIKEKFLLDEAQLGLLLLSMPFGSIVSNPLSVVFIRAWGPVKVALMGGVMAAFAFALPVLMPSIPLLVIGMMLSGVAFSITNVAMNTCASMLEEVSGLRLISACHGMWSTGAMSGALISGLSIIPLQSCCEGFFAAQQLYVIFQFIVVVFITWSIRKGLDQVKAVEIPANKTPGTRLIKMKPGRDLWMIISICLCSYLTEGTIADWSAVYLRDVIHSSETIAGRGFAVYAFFMAGGRFLGDGLIARYGNMRVLRAGGFLVFAGVLIIIFSQTHFLAMPGFMLTGAGISLASPILYQASARVKGLPPGTGLALMNTFAMAAFLGGPVLIGFIAKLADLRISFLAVAIAAIIWIIQTTRVIRSTSFKV